MTPCRSCPRPVRADHACTRAWRRYRRRVGPALTIGDALSWRLSHQALRLWYDLWLIAHRRFD